MLDEKRFSRNTGWWLVVGILVLSVLWCAAGARAGAQDNPQPTPEISATWWLPTPTPEINRPMPLGVCKLAPGCSLLPLVRTP